MYFERVTKESQCSIPRSEKIASGQTCHPRQVRETSVFASEGFNGQQLENKRNTPSLPFVLSFTSKILLKHAFFCQIRN